MTDSQEIRARIVIAETEARRALQAKLRTAQYWRTALTVARIVFCFAAALWLFESGWRFSGTQAVAFLLIALAGIAWRDYRQTERIRALEAELERLKSDQTSS